MTGNTNIKNRVIFPPCYVILLYTAEYLPIGADLVVVVQGAK